MQRKTIFHFKTDKIKLNQIINKRNDIYKAAKRIEKCWYFFLSQLTATGQEIINTINTLAF